ncbi:MAG: BACON domain-containing protein [Bacteroidales bacterium]|nr:BACON domain-containing protein [Bacteroidales bacterium]
MKKIHTLICCAAVLVLPLLVSCEKEEPLITFDMTSIDMKDAGGSQNVSLTTNYNWTATTSDPWIQVSPASGKKGTSTLTIRVEASDRSTSRKGTVTITCRELIRGVGITQMPHLGQSLVFKHSASRFSVPSLTGSSVAATVKWGDGSEENYSSSLWHDYSAAGTHTVEINAAGAYSFKLESVAGVTEIDFSNF